ncbi:MAG: hypothetical protein K2N86_03025 [Rikenellaceae bacterium]|nr:hypothetical protein [Rikenellaceae bacterium]MDE7355646.1 hypothetical protein [Rikenellaceae bacterium]
MATLVTILIAVIFTALLMLGLSITLLRKGHHIQGEVGENDEMKKRGLKCATAEIIEEERALGLLPDEESDRCTPSCSNNCSTCADSKSH